MLFCCARSCQALRPKNSWASLARRLASSTDGRRLQAVLGKSANPRCRRRAWAWVQGRSSLVQETERPFGACMAESLVGSSASEGGGSAQCGGRLRCGIAMRFEDVPAPAVVGRYAAVGGTEHCSVPLASENDSSFLEIPVSGFCVANARTVYLGKSGQEGFTLASIWRT